MGELLLFSQAKHDGQQPTGKHERDQEPAIDFADLRDKAGILYELASTTPEVDALLYAELRQAFERELTSTDH